ncbi:serine/arginine-rich splicing factor 4-like [Dermacentor albipictus]|uniref:serine/arginine-rich splicing factor 4-like n=1 Tax=Dermacentor albipictus TaxID=60249 RepID=UPI0038FD057A
MERRRRSSSSKSSSRSRQTSRSSTGSGQSNRSRSKRRSNSTVEASAAKPVQAAPAESTTGQWKKTKAPGTTNSEARRGASSRRLGVTVPPPHRIDEAQPAHRHSTGEVKYITREDIRSSLGDSKYPTGETARSSSLGETRYPTGEMARSASLGESRYPTSETARSASVGEIRYPAKKSRSTRRVEVTFSVAEQQRVGETSSWKPLILKIALVVGLLAVVLTAVFVLLMPSRPSGSAPEATASAGPYAVCETADCVAHAKILLSTDPAASNPCDDFGLFVCSAWKKPLMAMCSLTEQVLRLLPITLGLCFSKKRKRRTQYA